MLTTFIWLLLLVITIGILGYLRPNLNKATWVIGGWLILVAITNSLHDGMWILWLGVLSIITIVNLPKIRRNLISKPAMKLLKTNLPSISQTEQELSLIHI